MTDFTTHRDVCLSGSNNGEAFDVRTYSGIPTAAEIEYCESNGIQYRYAVGTIGGAVVTVTNYEGARSTSSGSGVSGIVWGGMLFFFIALVALFMVVWK